MLERRTELEYFFQKYKEFLKIESIVSLIKGRDYEVIKHFYHLFLEISQYPIKEDEAKLARNKLECVFNKYKEENKGYQTIDFTRGHSDATSIDVALNKGAKISQAFSLLTEAIKQYSDWRKCLSKEAIQEIYLKNLSDKQKYYFNKPLDKFNQESLKQYLKNNEVANNNILRQSLIEFHNAISHLNAIYWNTGDNNINTDRAASHFKRGALDSHKAIIKDFYLLTGNDIDMILEKIVSKLKKLRMSEYQTIGDDKKRDSSALCKGYQDFTTEIIKLRK